MISSRKTFLLAAATAFALPAMANAANVNYDATLVANQTFTGVSLIAPGDTVRFRFTVLEDLIINAFSVAGTGNATGDDLRAIRFGLGPVKTFPFSTVLSDGTASSALGFLQGGTYLAGTKFRVVFFDGISSDVGLTLSFRTNPVPAVPLPATAILLFPLLLAGGLAGWWRRMTAKRSLA